MSALFACDRVGISQTLHQEALLGTTVLPSSFRRPLPPPTPALLIESGIRCALSGPLATV